jgi:ABC-type dipeptide/oligopeptide/nickel transport system permease subunit
MAVPTDDSLSRRTDAAAWTAFLPVPLAWDAWALACAVRAGERAGVIRRMARLIAGAVGAAILLWALRDRMAPPCCAASTALDPGAPVGRLVMARLPVTLAVLAVALPLGGLLSAGLGALVRRADTLGGLVGAMFAAPVGSTSLLVMLTLGVRWGVVPVAGGGVVKLLLAGLLAAALPAALAARSGDAAAAFFAAGGWLLGAVILADAVMNLDGLGGLLLSALRQGDAPAAFGITAALSGLMLVLRLRFVAAHALRASAPRGREAHRHPGGAIPAARLVFAAGLVTLALGWAAAGAILPSPEPDSTAVYAPRSAAHPLGTDRLGRDTLAAAGESARDLWAAALVGGLAALGLGGAWGLAAARIGARNDALRDVILIPAEALILFQPALIGLALGGVGSGAALGLILAPRAALALAKRRHGVALPPPAAWAALAVLTSFAALQYSQAVRTLAGSGPLRYHAELIAGAQVAPDGRFLWLAMGLIAPGALAAAGAYLAAGALADVLLSDDEDVLPRFFS